jgi:hypothetical protein
MANPTTNYGFVLPTPTDLVTDLPADFEVALQGVDTQMKTNADAATQKATLTTTGDIYYASAGSTPARLGIGTTGQVLQVTGGLPAWGTAPAGGMTLLSTTTLSGATTTISSIPTGYVDLRLILRNVDFSASGSLQIYFNGDTAANRHRGVNTINATDTFNDVYMTISGQNNATTLTNLTSIFIPDYSNTTTWKLLVSDWLGVNSSTATNWSYFRNVGFYNQTPAISSITVRADGQTFTGGTALLYGVK